MLEFFFSIVNTSKVELQTVPSKIEEGKYGEKLSDSFLSLSNSDRMITTVRQCIKAYELEYFLSLAFSSFPRQLPSI